VKTEEPLENVLACRICGQAHLCEPMAKGWRAKCRKCGAVLVEKNSSSLHFTTAFVLAALLLYGPANFFPILRMNLYGATSENTVWDGCVRLYQDGDLVIAIIVFLASILVPFLKLLGLLFLVISARFKLPKWQGARTRVYKIIDVIGRWAMLDVFAVAVMVSLVKLSRLATVVPGSGALAFTGVVVFTFLASATFDPQLIWNYNDDTHPTDLTQAH
jgi:paraquat-inducible protein A